MINGGGGAGEGNDGGKHDQMMTGLRESQEETAATTWFK
jgi:hypothetical protein